MKVIDEEKRGTGRTLRLIFRALSYAGERVYIQVICGDKETAEMCCETLVGIAKKYHVPGIIFIKDGSNKPRISGTLYKFKSQREFSEIRYCRGATVLFDHWALEQMEEGRKKPE